jgi:hypothetical protein
MTRMTLADVEAHQRRVKGSAPRETPNVVSSKKSKFKNIRCQAKDGTNFASKLERDYYEDLLLRWKAGEVLWFTRQVPFWLEGGVKYVLDFLIVEQLVPGVPMPNLRLVDTTGTMTNTKRNKLKQLKARYGLDVEIATK